MGKSVTAGESKRIENMGKSVITEETKRIDTKLLKRYALHGKCRNKLPATMS